MWSYVFCVVPDLLGHRLGPATERRDNFAVQKDPLLECPSYAVASTCGRHLPSIGAFPGFGGRPPRSRAGQDDVPTAIGGCVWVRVALFANSSMIPHRRRKGANAKICFDPSAYLMMASESSSLTLMKRVVPGSGERPQSVQAKAFAVGGGTAYYLNETMVLAQRWFAESDDDCQKVIPLYWYGYDFS